MAGAVSQPQSNSVFQFPAVPNDSEAVIDISGFFGKFGVYRADPLRYLKELIQIGGVSVVAHAEVKRAGRCLSPL